MYVFTHICTFLAPIDVSAKFTGKESPILDFLLLCNRHFPALDPMNLPRERGHSHLPSIPLMEYIHVYMCIYICVHMHMCIHLYVWMCVYINILIYIQIYIFILGWYQAELLMAERSVLCLGTLCCGLLPSHFPGLAMHLSGSCSCCLDSKAQ